MFLSLLCTVECPYTVYMIYVFIIVQLNAPILCTWYGFLDKQSPIQKYRITMGSQQGSNNIFNGTEVPGYISQYSIQGEFQLLGQDLGVNNQFRYISIHNMQFEKSSISILELKIYNIQFRFYEIRRCGSQIIFQLQPRIQQEFMNLNIHLVLKVYQSKL